MERFCRNCGAELKINAKFCPKCGCKIIESLLIKRIKNGDTQAWEELYKMTYPRAYAVAVQTMKNREDALDVLQEAYISVFKNIDSLQDETKLNVWVSKIVGNRCIDYLRKYRGKNEPTLFGEMISDDSDVEFEDILENENQEFIPEESVDYDETKKIMQGILDQLPDEQRLCVLMYYYDELSVKEIAETLGCSTGTVKSRLNYARKYIKKEVEKQEKKGTKLYSIAPISFLIWMLHSQENTVQAKAAEPSVWKAVQTKAGMLEHMPLPGQIITVIVLLVTIGGGIVDILGRREKNRQIIEEHKRNQLEIQKDKKRIESELKKVPAVKVQLEQCEKNIKDTEEILQHLYEMGRFFPKYRNLVAVSQIYEYILSGRCTELGGFQGAYNLYEQETRMDIVIMQLDDIYEELEEIKENQYMLYDAICQTNYMLSQIADDAAVAAYNTEVIITNQRICQRYYMV